MKELDNLAIVGVLGAVAILAFFFAIPDANTRFVDLIIGGFLGYLAKAANSPQS